MPTQPIALIGPSGIEMAVALGIAANHHGL